MKTRFLILLATTVLVGCGLGDKAEQVRQMAEAAEEALKSGDTAGALGAFLGGGEPVQPVDFRRLKELLPERLGDLPREEATGERSRMMGIGTSKAQATYRTEGSNANMNLSIVDFGSMRAITMMGLGWAMVDIDNESESGFERTVKHEGYPAYVKYNHSGRSSNGQMSVIVEERFVVTVNGYNVDAEAIEEAWTQIDLDHLADMKDVGVGEAPPETPDFSEFMPQAAQSASGSSGDGEGPDNRAETAGDGFGQMNDGRHIEPIDFRALRDLLPSELPGMARIDAEGEKSGAAGFLQSSAKGTYQVEGDRRSTITIKIKDLGNMAGGMIMGGYPWMMTETDRESDTGFERTTTYEGYPAIESYSTRGRSSGKIHTVVEKRFAVEVDGRGVDWQQIRGAIDQVDLGELAARKDEGVTTTS